MRISMALFLVGHGLVHALYVGHARRLFAIQAGARWPDGSWALSRPWGDPTVRWWVSSAAVRRSGARVRAGRQACHTRAGSQGLGVQAEDDAADAVGTMRAVVYTTYGPPDVLRMADIVKPAVRPNAVLVRVRATTVTIGDTIMRSLRIPVPGWQKVMARAYLGWSRPKRTVLGMELAGDVEAVGHRVTRFAPGDAVFASTFAVGFGGYAEYACLPEHGVLALKPAALSYEQAAAVPGAGMTAWHCLGKGVIQPGQQVLVYGASGAVGTTAVQLAAHHFGAEVTAVCSAANFELVEGLGASRVVDYARPGFDLGSAVYDVVFDAVGKLAPALAKRALKPGGTYLNVHTVSGGANTLANLVALTGVIEAGRLRPAIDRVYPFERIVEAHRYVETGRKRGHVVIDVERHDRQ